MSEFVSLEQQEHCCVITMDDGKANALGFDMFGGLNAALDEAEPTGKVVVLTGRPGRFSAGFDLNVMAKMDPDTARLLHLGAGLLERLLKFPRPIVIAASGHSLAMGGLLLLAVDYRIGTSGEFRLGLNEVGIGMTLPYFGVHLARARLARTYEHRAVALAEVFDPEGAVQAGFLDEEVAEVDLLSRAMAVAKRLAGLDMQAHHNTKLRVREPLLAALEGAMDEFPLTGD